MGSAKEQTPGDRQFYELAENEAKGAKRGLWGDPEPMSTGIETRLFSGVRGNRALNVLVPRMRIFFL